MATNAHLDLSNTKSYHRLAVTHSPHSLVPFRFEKDAHRLPTHSRIHTCRWHDSSTSNNLNTIKVRTTYMRGEIRLHQIYAARSMSGQKRIGWRTMFNLRNVHMRVCVCRLSAFASNYIPFQKGNTCVARGGSVVCVVIATKTHSRKQNNDS